MDRRTGPALIHLNAPVCRSRHILRRDSRQEAAMREADLDRVTKKQLVALAEQRLQTQLTGERRIFLNQQIDLELANMA